MARCLGPNSPYGCGHHDEHVEAAKKGWLHRRRGMLSEHEHRAVSALFGPIEQAHEHKSHKGQIAFKQEGKWYELPRARFRQLVSEGVKAQRAEEREQARQEKAQQRYEGAQERQLQAARRAEYQSVVRRIRQMGGIRPYRANSTGGKTPEEEEWKSLPRSVKTRDSRRGAALDDMAQSMNEEYPWLKLETGEDLRNYLGDKRNQGNEPAKLHLSRPAKAPEPEKPPAPKIVVSQRSDGQWIITRVYPDGHVAGQPGTYANKAAAEKAAKGMKHGLVVKPAMFDERKESYGEGFFQ